MTDATEVPATLEFKAVTPERWPDLAQLFKTAQVGPNYCFYEGRSDLQGRRGGLPARAAWRLIHLL